MKMKHVILSLFTLCLIGQNAQCQENFMLKDGDTVIFLGDDITESATTPEGFITLIKLYCGVNGYDIKTINAGNNNDTCKELLARLDVDVVQKKPDWVVISCGMNDVRNFYREYFDGVKLSVFKMFMNETIDRCLKSGAKVLLLTPTPVTEMTNSPVNQLMINYNDYLRELAKEKKLVLCDLNSTFHEIYKKKRNSDNLLTTDGMHMNPRGNRLMAREILKALGAKGNEIRRAENQWELIGNMQPMGIK